MEDRDSFAPRSGYRPYGDCRIHEYKFLADGAEIVQSTLSAARDVGIDAEITGFNAGSDARFLVQAGRKDDSIYSL